MAPSGPDASNSSLPVDSPVIRSCPPVPSTTRGERCTLDGLGGRQHKDKALVAYASGKLVVVRTLDDAETPLFQDHTPKLPVLSYRGHGYPVTAVKVSTSGAYVASGDERGLLRVWALDHPDHLCKYASTGLTGPIRDLQWDGESQKVGLAGDRAANDASSDCAKVLQYDTGVTVGQLSMHMKGRVSSMAMKPQRPYRVVTAGADDTKCCFHKGPPFAKIASQDGVPCENGHDKGSVFCVRYSASGDLVASVGTDRTIVIYDGKTLEKLHKTEQVHTATIYSVAWSKDDTHIMTASGDGTCKLFAVSKDGKSVTEEHVWKPAEFQLGRAYEKVPVGGNQVGCAFIQGGEQSICVGLNGQISMLPKKGSSDPIKLVTGHYAAMCGIALDRNNSLFYTGDSDGLLCRWNAETCKPDYRLYKDDNKDLMYVVHGGAVSGVACLGSGTLLSVGWDDTLYVTEPGAKTPNNNSHALGAQPKAIAAGTEVAVVATVSGLILVSDKGAKISSMISLGYDANCVVVSSDDKTAFVGGSDCSIHIFTIKGDTLEETGMIEKGHLQPLQALALSNDGKKLAAGDVKDVCVWDWAEKKALVGKGRWCFHVQKITALAWSLDDQYLVSGGADDALYVWSEASKMKRLHFPYAHRGGVSGLAFMKNGQLLSVGADSVVNQWDLTQEIKKKFG